MQSEETVALWLYMAEVWPSYRLPEDAEARSVRMTVWQDVLGDLPATAVRAAIVEHAGDEFAPPPGALRASALRLTGNKIPDLDEAWAEVRKAIAEGGFHSYVVEWSHPAIRSAVEAIGWYRLCRSDNQEALFAHFAQVFKPAAVRADRRAALPAAVGESVAALAPAQRQVVVSLADRMAARAKELEE